MSKHAHAKNPWPTWKIAAVALICAGLGTALFIATAYLPPPPVLTTQPANPKNGPDPTAFSSIGLNSIVILLGLLCWGIALTFAGWLAYKIYRRIPAWKRRQMFGR